MRACAREAPELKILINLQLLKDLLVKDYCFSLAILKELDTGFRMYARMRNIRIMCTETKLTDQRSTVKF